jgi:DNA-binding XRE family transcriptional regulator
MKKLEPQKVRGQRAKLWKEFRRDNLLTQEKLAEVLGISRREVQYIEAGKISAGANVLSKFRTLELKYRRSA